MSPKTLFLTSLLVALDVVSGLNIERLRAVEPLKEGGVFGYSIPPGLLKRQTATCPVGTRQCARTATQILCAGVCCFEDGEFSFGCDIGFYCDGTGANAGCCRVGRICTDAPPPCVDNGEPAPSPTSACPADQPTCTTNARGAPICSGEVTQTATRSFTITRTNTISVTTTSEIESETTEEPETTTTEEEETTTTTEVEPTTTEETTTVEETITTTSEIPEETTTELISTTEVETTEFPTVTAIPTQSLNATLTPLPPATSNSGRTSTVNLLFALASVALAFFLF